MSKNDNTTSFSMIADYEGDIVKLFEGGNDGEYPILATRNLILFPAVVTPILIGRQQSLNLIKRLEKKPDTLFCVFCQKKQEVDNPSFKDLYDTGVFARIVRVLDLPGGDGNVTVIVQGLGRCHLEQLTSTRPYIKGLVTNTPETLPSLNDIEYATALEDFRQTAIDYVKKNEDMPNEAEFAIQNISNGIIRVNFVCSSMPFSVQEKIQLLRFNDGKERLFAALRLLHRDIQFMELKQNIRSRTREDLDEQQREYFLQQTFYKELDKLDMLNPQGPEYSVQLNYLQTMVSLPWNEYTEDDIDLKRAQKVLDKDHYGMEKVKERILEYMAVLQLRGDLKSPIICLYGPPGVGKTSLGKSIAASMKRKYVRISLGGLHDESEIRGHRRTYVGAMPGRIIKSIQDYDLSKVLFIATANDLNTIPRPLLDRMEIIEVSGYITEEKIEIAKRHLIPKVKENTGLDSDKKLSFNKAAIEKIIEQYTRESGVRQLEKQIDKAMRKLALKKATDGTLSFEKITPEVLEGLLGKPPFYRDIYQGNEYAGVVTGLAWTSVGGEILFIETSLSKGKGSKLTLTGNLGDVMKESAVLALEYVKAHAELLNIDYRIFDNYNIHIHVPEGATPKDGPSAGITIATSIASALTQRKVRKNTAMTGEITLRGKVLPVGGIKEKILAAKRAGITDIIMCRDNKKDIDEIPEVYLKGVEFHYVENVQDVWNFALTDEIVKNPIPFEISDEQGVRGK